MSNRKEATDVHIEKIRLAIDVLENPKGAYVQRRAKIQDALVACNKIADVLDKDQASDGSSLCQKFDAVAHYAKAQEELATYERPSGRYLANDEQRLSEYVKQARLEFSEMVRALQGECLSPELKAIDEAFALRDELRSKQLSVSLLATTLKCADRRVGYVAYGVTGKIDHVPKIKNG